MSATMTPTMGSGGFTWALSALRNAAPSHSSPWIVATTRSSNLPRTQIPLRAVAPESHSGAVSWLWDNSELRGTSRSLLNHCTSVTTISAAEAGVVDALAMEDQDLEAGHGVAKLMAELRAAYMSGRTRTPAWRVQQLTGIVRMLAEREGEIVEALFADLGKPAHEAYVSEISLVRSSCKQAIKELKRWMAPVKVSGNVTTFPSTAAVVSEPFGVTLVISAWNFPFWLIRGTKSPTLERWSYFPACWFDDWFRGGSNALWSVSFGYVLSVDPMIGAISAGCAMVLKPSEVAPATSALLAKLVPLYLDSSVIRLVEGGVEETTALLEQKWDKIFYTGSAKVGRIVMAAASKHLTPVTLELGGKCPAYFDRSANLKVGLRRIAQGKWGNNNGQACVAPDYILVDESIASELVDTLKDIIEKFYGKDPKLSKDLSRIVNAAHYSRLTNLLDDPRISSKIVHGGERDENKLYIAPTLVCDVPLDAPLMLEEIFGPVLPIIKVKGEQEAVDIINDRAKPLAAYVFTSKKEVEERMVASISSGGMVVNDAVLHFVIHGLPFGGVGESGMGSYHGKFSFDAFSHKKAVLYRNSLGDVPARYPPFTKKKQSFLRCVLDGNYVGAILYLTGLKK